MQSLREWIKNVALFYVIILLMISIPVVVVLTVLSIKAIISLRYWIAGGILVSILLISFVLYRHRKKYKEDLWKNKDEILRALERAIRAGHDVDISVMGGLLKISCKCRDKSLLPVSEKEIASLPESMSHDNKPAQLEE